LTFDIVGILAQGVTLYSLEYAQTRIDDLRREAERARQAAAVRAAHRPRRRLFS